MTRTATSAAAVSAIAASSLAKASQFARFAVSRLFLALFVAIGLTSQAWGIAYTWNVVGPANWNAAGSWTPGGGPPTTSDTGAINSGTATANATLTGSPAITLGGTGVLFINALAVPLTTSGTVNATGGRIDFQGTSTSASTISLGTGAAIGKPQSNVLAVFNNPLSIAAGASVTARNINSTVTRSILGLQMNGALSSGDNLATLVINPSVAGQLGPLVLAPSVANTGFIGNVNIQQGPSATTGTLVLSGTGALSNVNAITINSGAQLRFRNATNPLPSAYALNVPTGARVEWEGATSVFSVTAPTITFQNGSSLGHEEDSNVGGVSNAIVNIAAGATVTASRINATVSRSTLGVQLSGPLTSGDSASTLAINPVTAGFRGALFIAPTTANTGFTGNVTLQGVGTTLGTLVLGGTGALSNVNSLTVNSGGLLRFRNATDPLPSAYGITIPSGGRMEWEGSSPVYTVTPPTITFQNGSEMGREEDSNVNGTSRDNLVLASGATVTVSRINGTLARTDLGLTLVGTLSGDATTTLRVQGGSGMFGPLTINPTATNAFAGTVEVAGTSAALQGSLVLRGTGPLANAALLDVQNFGTAVVFQAGAANGIDEIRVHNGGTLRFRDNAGSAIGNTSFTGDGRIRSELVDSATTSLVLVDQTVRSLNVVNSTIAPGLSAGTLTVQASTLSLGTGTTLEIELGGISSDLLAVSGNLVLSPGSTLDLSSLGGLQPGDYVIATYSGTLVGEFGSIISNLPSPLVFESINYGSLLNGQITVTLGVPEPTTGALVAFAIGGTLAIRRRRCR